MLVAVESWVKRDHEAEWKQWTARWSTSPRASRRFPASPPRVRNEPRRSQQSQPAPGDPLGLGGAGHHRRRRSPDPAHDRAAHRAGRRRRRGTRRRGAGPAGRHRHLDQRRHDAARRREDRRGPHLSGAVGEAHSAGGGDTSPSIDELVRTMGCGDSVRRERRDAHPPSHSGWKQASRHASGEFSRPRYLGDHVRRRRLAGIQRDRASGRLIELSVQWRRGRRHDVWLVEPRRVPCRRRGRLVDMPAADPVPPRNTAGFEGAARTFRGRCTRPGRATAPRDRWRPRRD